jgi:hypothetical protein
MIYAASRAPAVPLFGAIQTPKPSASTEKIGRVTGRREAEPPEVAQITDTVVPGVPWKYRAIA